MCVGVHSSRKQSITRPTVYVVSIVQKLHHTQKYDPKIQQNAESSKKMKLTKMIQRLNPARWYNFDDQEMSINTIIYIICRSTQLVQPHRALNNQCMGRTKTKSKEMTLDCARDPGRTRTLISSSY